ncbi:hypothetical protein [Ralstonia mannitolilytica]|uniref:hypothetical protein n=1 Tax=Ralstonia mannitolilytica TaxID=105219 RepID=UPI0005D7DDA4|nr:hypothetical protein [Ralstonia mannitolilytica]AJW43763.1 hypothetical protein TK49_02940 [Ralstonia mannitolilytica]QIF09001.1 hypothetical protein G5A69_16120 [Ralstonia mannitolilytica]
MHTHTFTHPILPERKVRTGFHWSALVFGTLWAFSEGLIAQGGRLAGVDAIAALLVTLDRNATPEVTVAATGLFFVKNVYCGIRASDWLEDALRQAGYRRIT